MSDVYLNSSSVKVFPSAYRGTATTSGKLYNPEAKLNSEAAFVNIIKRATSRESFVLSYENHKLVCNISGYWFELTLDETKFVNDGTPWEVVWANIKVDNLNTTVDTDNTVYPAKSLISVSSAAVAGGWLDSSDTFIGLSLSDTKQTGTNVTESFPILIHRQSGFSIYPGSQIRLDTKVIANTDNAHSIDEQFAVRNYLILGPNSTNIKEVTGFQEDGCGVIYLSSTDAYLDWVDDNGIRSRRHLIYNGEDTLDFSGIEDTVLSEPQLSLNEDTHILTITYNV